MVKATRATQFLDRSGVTYTLHTYDYDPDADSIGQAAAAALGEPAGRVFKTLMVLADGKPACVIAPSDREVAMKKAAAALGVKQAVMMKPADAERITGYKIGGISPFGQTRKVPVVIDASAQEWDSIYINGGQRGLQVRLAPDDAISALGARQAEIAV